MTASGGGSEGADAVHGVGQRPRRVDHAVGEGAVLLQVHVGDLGDDHGGGIEALTHR